MHRHGYFGRDSGEYCDRNTMHLCDAETIK